jgi:hypothetical protein
LLPDAQPTYCLQMGWDCQRTVATLPHLRLACANQGPHPFVYAARKRRALRKEPAASPPVLDLTERFESIPGIRRQITEEARTPLLQSAAARKQLAIRSPRLQRRAGRSRRSPRNGPRGCESPRCCRSLGGNMNGPAVQACAKRRGGSNRIR